VIEGETLKVYEHEEGYRYFVTINHPVVGSDKCATTPTTSQLGVLGNPPEHRDQGIELLV
jgi:hypothetical protein